MLPTQMLFFQFFFYLFAVLFSNNILLLLDFSLPSHKFHDFPGLEIDINNKFHDFPGFPWPEKTLLVK